MVWMVRTHSETAAVEEPHSWVALAGRLGLLAEMLGFPARLAMVERVAPTLAAAKPRVVAVVVVDLEAVAAVPIASHSPQ
jgi:hypothetical protein